MTKLTVRRLATNLPRKLRACGLLPDEVDRLLHVLNLGSEQEIIDEYGRRCRVGTDPKTADVYMDEVSASPVLLSGSLVKACCRACGALNDARAGVCVRCGETP